MKATLSKVWSDFLGFLKKQYQDRPQIFNGILAIFAIAVVGLIALSLIRGLIFPISSADRITSMPTILPTTTMYPMPQVVATPTFQPTTTPTVTNVWEVSAIGTKKTIDGYTALVVEFRNTTTGEVREGQCQSPHDPAPAIGDRFISEVQATYILLSPAIAGTNQIDINSKVQRFIFIP